MITIMTDNVTNLIFDDRRQDITMILCMVLYRSTQKNGVFQLYTWHIVCPLLYSYSDMCSGKQCKTKQNVHDRTGS